MYFRQLERRLENIDKLINSKKYSIYKHLSENDIRVLKEEKIKIKEECMSKQSCINTIKYLNAIEHIKKDHSNDDLIEKYYMDLGMCGLCIDKCFTS